MFTNGDLVVIVNGPNRGHFGNYEYRGANYETVLVRQGCWVIMIDPKDLERYDEYKHGILSF